MKAFVKFIRRMGIPSLLEGTQQNTDITELAEIAVTNKLQPFLAQRLDRGRIWLLRYSELVSLLVRIGESLDDLNYAVIKTLRPIPHLPSDVDILIHPAHFKEAFRRLTKDGFGVLSKSPYGVTLHNSETGFNVDLNEELTVAGIKYIDRNLILGEKKPYEIDGTMIKIPKPHADLLVIIDHSVFKERIYTLRDFYTIMLWLRYLPQMLDLASGESDSAAVQLFLTVTYLISNEAIGEDHVTTKQLARTLTRSPKGGLENVPYKYRLIDLINAYALKADYFSKRKRFEGLARYGLSTKNIRLFVNNMVRKAY